MFLTNNSSVRAGERSASDWLLISIRQERKLVELCVGPWA